MKYDVCIPLVAWRSAAAALALAICAAVFPAAANEPSETAPVEEKKVDFKTLKSPVPYTEKSIARGQTIYRRYCTECHGINGKAQIDVIADASDLTAPKLYYSGTTEGEIFRSIRDGAGVSMPPFKMQIRRESDTWHLVNFVRSLWPKDKQPELQKDKESDEPAEADEEDEADE